MLAAVKQRTKPTPSDPHRRGGFSLIELMIVIVIIGILMGLLLPAIQNARVTAQASRVTAEISDMEAALANFKGKFDMYPPSSITLYEDPADWNTDARSRGFVRRMWPQFDFALGRDLNGNGMAGEAGVNVTLLNAECLVFFLGGFQDANGAMVGFSKNHANPFTTAGTNREGPFYEFDISRFVDLDGDGYPEYRDSLPGQTAPYLYYSSYDGRGYDCNELDPTMTDVYRTGPDVIDGTTITCPPAAGTTLSPAYKDQSYQIISPGFNYQYGNGGHFDAQDPNNSVDLQEDERDNITNFHKGMLIP